MNMSRGLWNLAGKVLVRDASLRSHSLAGLRDGLKHLAQHLIDLSIVKVGDSELESLLAGNLLSHDSLLSGPLWSGSEWDPLSLSLS